MRVQRLFTKQGQSPYEGVRFVSRASKIAKLDGTVVFEASSVVVPDTWDQVAVDILAQKYFRRAGCDFTHSGSLYNHPLAVAIRSTISIIPTGNRGEWDLRQVIHRLVGSWVTQGEAYGYFDTQEDIQAFYDEMSYMMATQMFAPNSPQWFNTGLKFAYGIEGEASGHYYVDPITDVAIKSTDSYSHPSSSACFILSIKDDLVGPGGIMDLLMREARIYKHGSGAGSNYSNIRGAGEPLSGGGVSSGLLSFLKAGDASAGAIKSGGTSRRAARMVSLDGDHPDIESFVHWKVAEEQKVAMLVAGSKLLTSTWDSMVKAYAPSEIPGIQDDPLLNPDLIKIMKRAKKDGVPMPFLDQCIKRLVQGDFRSIIPTYDLGWEGEAYGTVTSQNANNTVRFSDAFMEAVLADQDWNLLRRTDGKVHKTLKARDLWDQVVDAAWSCADPGMQFDDTINNWHTGLASGRIKSSNPCSEFLYINDSSCNLASTNLMQFQTTPNFDVEAYTHANRLITIMLEITVAMSQYPTETLARNSHDHRPLGLGYANLGNSSARHGPPL